jgi:hypothetical protein
MHVFKHPKYYKELRKRNKSDQAISLKTHDGECERAPDPGQSTKPQATSSKRQAPSVKLSNQPVQAASDKHQAPSSKHQASSLKLQAQ